MKGQKKSELNFKVVSMVPLQHPGFLAHCDVRSGAVLDQSLTGALWNPSSGVPLRIQSCCEIHTYMKSDMARKKKQNQTNQLGIC